MTIAAIALRHGRTAEFPAPYHQRVVQHARPSDGPVAMVRTG
jgi:hypothetical protein